MFKYWSIWAKKLQGHLAEYVYTSYISVFFSPCAELTVLKSKTKAIKSCASLDVRSQTEYIHQYAMMATPPVLLLVISTSLYVDSLGSRVSRAAVFSGA